MSQRHEFVLLASEAGVNFRQLCRRFRLSPKTGYKWLKRFRAGGLDALGDRSRRPQSSPRICESAVAAKVIALRQQHPAWGGRKLHRRLCDLQEQAVPAASTRTAILRRRSRSAPGAGVGHTACQRFARAQPNELWQMDFKGHFATQAGPRCHESMVLDDHSRFYHRQPEAPRPVGAATCAAQVDTRESLRDYLLGQWSLLSAHRQHGESRLDNNLVENVTPRSALRFYSEIAIMPNMRG